MRMDTHHALLFVGNSAAQIAEEVSQIRERGAVVSLYEHSEWGIALSRSLIEDAYRTDGAGAIRVLAIITTAMTMEAQNALLKLFEEPPAATVFLLFLPNDTFLLPTLASRLQRTNTISHGEADVSLLTTLLAEPLAAQLSEIETRTKKKDTAWIMAFKVAALHYLARERTQLAPAASDRLYYALSHIGTRGASNKMLLEEALLTFSSCVKTR